jgi:hypothetical protein
VVIFGSALPLLIFFTSPTNKPKSPFLPFLYAATSSGCCDKTSSIHISISSVDEVCNKLEIGQNLKIGQK